MTVGQKLHQTLTSLQSAQTDLKSFALDTQDQNAKKMFSDYAQQLDTVVQGLKGRVNYTEQQEPAYKQFSNQNNNQNLTNNNNQSFSNKNNQSFK